MNATDVPITPGLPHDILDQLPPAVRHYIAFLENIIQQQQERIKQLEVEVHDLKARLAKNSSNSGKPPSSDGLTKKPKSLRGQSDKKPGGQNGHAGKNLSPIENPDHIVTHTPLTCECGSSLEDVNGSVVESRQVFDIPEPKVEVTEHRIEAKKCPCCNRTCKASFPENVRGPVQYGERVQAFAAYFIHQHFIPIERLCQLFQDIYGISISPGTCSNIDKKLFENLAAFETSLKAYLLAAEVLHFDETGMRCLKKLHWVHLAASDAATFYTIHAKRGKEAMDEMDILPQFKGKAIHDHWFPYFAYEQVFHGLCNVHHLRELTFIHEQEKEDWAKQMKDLLVQAKKETEKYLEQGFVPQEILLKLDLEYTRIVTEGINYHAGLEPLPKAKRGRQKQRSGKNLLDRLRDYKDCVLRFLYDLSVPFTNNLGEQDIRMVKLKQKIAGCFRTLEGGKIFCRVRSYISTARKQGWNILESIADAIRGCPKLLGIPEVDLPQTVAA
jgi:transposase